MELDYNHPCWSMAAYVLDENVESLWTRETDRSLENIQNPAKDQSLQTDRSSLENILDDFCAFDLSSTPPRYPTTTTKNPIFWQSDIDDHETLLGWRIRSAAAMAQIRDDFTPRSFLPAPSFNCSNGASEPKKWRRYGCGSRYSSGYGSGCRSLSPGSLDDLKGAILLLAKDRDGHTFLIEKLEENNGGGGVIDDIFSELRNHVPELMTHQFGNYIVQKLFEFCNVDQLNSIVNRVIRRHEIFLSICRNVHGSRSVQKMMECVKTRDQKLSILSALRRITVQLTKSANGYHVLQHCLKLFSPRDIRPLLSVIAKNCLAIAMDKSGCCVLQQFLGHSQGEIWRYMVSCITADSRLLSEHPFGNYIVQYLVGLEVPNVWEELHEHLSGSYVKLSMNKYSSNVVEKTLKEWPPHLKIEIITELICDPNFPALLQDCFGSYVAQCALEVSKGWRIRSKLVNMIMRSYPILHSHPYGKRVLAKAKGNKNRF